MARKMPQTMQLFHVFGGTGFVIGIVAHFYLVLVVGLVQSVLMAAPSVPAAVAAAVVHEVGTAVARNGAEAVADSFDKWTLSIFILVSALVLVGISFLARWSWPIVSEKAIVAALVWLLYGVIVGNFGICMCCTNGSWAHVCGGAWYEHLSSSLWVVATLAAFLVDAWRLELRVVSLVVTLALSVILLVAPTNNCSVLPAASWIIFLRITLFHLLWHANRLQRIAESTAYGIYIRCARALDDARTVRTGDPDVLPLDVPSSLVSTWRFLAAIAQDMTHAEDILKHQGETLFATHSEKKMGNRTMFGAGGTLASTSRHIGNNPTEDEMQQEQHQNPVLTPVQTFLAALREARRGLPHLSLFAEGTVESGTARHDSENPGHAPAGRATAHWIDWKYRHYSHTLMLAIDTVRATWVLSVCPAYLPLVAFELAWFAYSIYHTCSEIVSTTRPVEAHVPK